MPRKPKSPSPKRKTKASSEGIALTQERLRYLLHYDPETGDFKWRFLRGGVREGKCGRVNHWGYREICVDKKLYRAHRLAFLYMTGEFPTKDVDHINRNKGDNRWRNLREVTMSQNMCNVPLKPSNTTGFIGVVWDKDRNKWRAQIRVNGKKTNLGRFDNVEDAIKAHDQAAADAFGEFAQLNRQRANDAA